MTQKTSPTAEHMLIICGPSGVGKSTMARRLLAARSTATLSVSVTTRPLRGAEKDGVDYWFVDDEAFDARVAGGEFAEWANVHGNRYGTTRACIEEAQGAGLDVIFDIDYQGAIQLKEAYPEAWAVLLVPPSMAELERRLRGRKTDTDEVIIKRLAKARHELAQYAAFEFVIINEAAVDEVLSIYDVLALRRGRGVASSTIFGE